ncbi:hypothetical protein J7E87_03250 [Streptomyces sp. ISL-1]|uniref:PARG family protein n=1 Tax=Streptomyces sp. ISL-1 TaxID=2817657 RepID=UPI001BE90E3F|nr:PARG family protein [Streptomyces sp. ISL-1]MBT2388453.1 hypothetical protein [Streptomyces sp. ISL-1]
MRTRLRGRYGPWAIPVTVGTDRTTFLEVTGESGPEAARRLPSADAGPVAACGFHSGTQPRRRLAERRTGPPGGALPGLGAAPVEPVLALGVLETAAERGIRGHFEQVVFAVRDRTAGPAAPGAYGGPSGRYSRGRVRLCGQLQP